MLNRLSRRVVAVAALALSAAIVTPGPAGASRALGVVVTQNPVGYTPNIADGAVYKMVQSAGTMYAGGEFTSVSTAPGVAPAGTFARTNLFGFDPGTGVVTSFAPRFDGPVWALVADGTSLWAGGAFTTVDGVARRGLVKFSLATGRVVTGFNARLDGKVTELALVKGKLIAGGTFATRLRAFSPTSGADTGYLKLGIKGSLGADAGLPGVFRFAVNPAKTRLVAIGNFTTVKTEKRHRMFMVNLGATSGSLSSWYYPGLELPCIATTVPEYLRDVDFAPDGSYFVVVSTGAGARLRDVGTSLCDMAARFDTATLAPRRPVWINYTGGDTLLSVAVTDTVVYVQGHQRWLDNPLGRNNAGAGAVSRQGIGAIDPTSGRATAWNPTKDRGIGGRDLYVTARGLWVGSDTTVIGGETHARIALLPVP